MEEELARIVEAWRIVERIVSRFARNLQDREDLTQTVLLDLLRSLRRSQFDAAKGSFGAWAARRAKSRAIDWLREQNRRRKAWKEAAEQVAARTLSRSNDDCRRLLWETTSASRDFELLLRRVEERWTQAQIAGWLGCRASEAGRELQRAGRGVLRQLEGGGERRVPGVQ